jgi:hypothetical protein
MGEKHTENCLHKILEGKRWKNRYLGALLAVLLKGERVNVCVCGGGGREGEREREKERAKTRLRVCLHLWSVCVCVYWCVLVFMCGQRRSMVTPCVVCMCL